jgi:predicted transcriptional regulator
MQRASLGDQELEILRYVAEFGPNTMGEVVDGYGTPRDLSRSTVVTVMERLRKKGYLQRDTVEGVFRYRCSVDQDEIVGGLIHRFVEKTLAGSLLPFATYFSRSNRLSESEQAELELLIAKLEGTPADSGRKETDR